MQGYKTILTRSTPGDTWLGDAAQLMPHVSLTRTVPPSILSLSTNPFSPPSLLFHPPKSNLVSRITRPHYLSYLRRQKYHHTSTLVLLALLVVLFLPESRYEPRPIQILFSAITRRRKGVSSPSRSHTELAQFRV